MCDVRWWVPQQAPLCKEGGNDTHPLASASDGFSDCGVVSSCGSVVRCACVLVVWCSHFPLFCVVLQSSASPPSLFFRFYAGHQKYVYMYDRRPGGHPNEQTKKEALLTTGAQFNIRSWLCGLSYPSRAHH